MKIRKLFLKAFGPFTNTVLDFSGPANLHVVYGANEAGKSSALRAMADLRYGVHARSTDGFLHGPTNLRLAGCFEDGAGKAVTLARRKGNKDTLQYADPETGEVLSTGPVPADAVLALTGGVSREQFETMFGLDSAHLREGGNMLIRGEGDLGAALFQASTGSAGIKAILETLQADAKTYFTPRGGSTVLVEAAKQLEESKQRYKLALTKPEQWKTLHRAHAEAMVQLTDCRSQLAQQRRRHAELTELRVVEPLLRQLDLAREEWSRVEGYAELPINAREKRLEAQLKQAQANAVLAEVDDVLAQCEHEAQGIHVDALLLKYAPSIDRLAADVGAIRRDQDKRVQLAASTDSEAQQLLQAAEHMTEAVDSVQTIDALFEQLLNAAEQAELEQVISEYRELARAHQQTQTQITQANNKLRLLQLETVEAPDPLLHKSLSLAVSQAQALGDSEKRLVDVLQSLQSEQRKLDRSLKELQLGNVDELGKSGHIPNSEVDEFDRARSELVSQLALHDEQVKRVKVDLLTQERRLKTLAAVGEVVTADTLKSARTQRDGLWHDVRALFIEKSQEPSAGLADQLPTGFERSQRDADRQADLLREGAKRAAEVAECEQRIAEMQQAILDLGEKKSAHEQSLGALDKRWAENLAGLGLPHGSAPWVREWLTKRQVALDQLDRLTDVKSAHERLHQQVSDAVAGMLTALSGLGQVAPAAARDLAPLLALGTALDQELVANKAAVARLKSDRTEADQRLQALLETETADSAKLLALRSSLDSSCSRIYLPAGSTPEGMKARLGELQRWANTYQLHAARVSQLAQMRASDTAASESAKSLGELLGDTSWTHLDAWFDGVSHRLALSREAHTRQLMLNKKVEQEKKRRQRAEAELGAATGNLASLVCAAGVESVDQLDEAEVRAEQRRSISSQLESLKVQLRQSSNKDTANIRAELASLDSVKIDLEKQECETEIERLDALEKVAITAEQAAALALAAIDTSDAAAHAREEMEVAMARYRAGVRPWAQLKLAHALLTEALRRYREKAQGPLVELAGQYFKAMTGDRFASLWVDDDGGSPMLKARPSTGAPVAIDALSEGTADQLYLALRLAALELQRQPDRAMPLVLDDVFMTSDDQRAAEVFVALQKFSVGGQVLVFTHHRHLTDIALRSVEPGMIQVHQLPPAFERSA